MRKARRFHKGTYKYEFIFGFGKLKEKLQVEREISIDNTRDSTKL